MINEILTLRKFYQLLFINFLYSAPFLSREPCKYAHKTVVTTFISPSLLILYRVCKKEVTAFFIPCWNVGLPLLATDFIRLVKHRTEIFVQSFLRRDIGQLFSIHFWKSFSNTIPVGSALYNQTSFKSNNHTPPTQISHL